MDKLGTSIALRLQNVRERMKEAAQRAGREPASIELVAVSKTHAAQDVLEAFDAGQRVFGENYVQEALAKQKAVAAHLAVADSIDWHFLGHIQKNKAKDVTGCFTLLQTIDALDCANIIARRLPDNIAQQSVLIQVNIGEESQKSGITEITLAPLLEALMDLPRIHIQGLMCLPPFFDGGERVRPYFVRMRLLLDAMRKKTGLALPTLSMGMSGDFSIAIEEGATLVRVGSDIFGERIKK